MARLPLVVIAVFATAACKQDQAPAPAPAPTAPAPAPAPAPLAALAAPCAKAPLIESLAPGLTLETRRPRTKPAVAIGDPCLRVLRADPARFDVVLGAGGAALTGPEWAARSGAVGVMNASMFHDGGASTGLLLDGDRVITSRENSKFGAFFAARAREKTSTRPAVTLWGRGCAGDSLDRLKRDYRLVVQNYRLLGCDGKPIAWKDEKVYSAAAVGVDAAGRVLFIHSRAPYRMAEFTRMLVEPELELGLVAAMYVEGGPEATLAVRAGDRAAVFVGSYESLFVENDDNVAAWKLPNVLMLVPKS